jgi:hypothetical protein
MSLVQKDYILRIIEAAGAALRRALRRKAGGDLEGARQEIASSTADLLGPAAELLNRVDASTAIDLMADPRRVVLWASLMTVDAAVLRAMKQIEAAEALEQRSADLLNELDQRDYPMDAQTAALLARLPAEES